MIELPTDCKINCAHRRGLLLQAAKKAGMAKRKHNKHVNPKEPMHAGNSHWTWTKTCKDLLPPGVDSRGAKLNFAIIQTVRINPDIVKSLPYVSVGTDFATLERLATSQNDATMRARLQAAAAAFKQGGGCSKLTKYFYEHLGDEVMCKQILDAAKVFKGGGGCEKLQEEFIKYIGDDDMCKQILDAAKVFKGGGGCEKLQEEFIKYIGDVDDKVRKQILDAAKVFKGGGGCEKLQEEFIKNIDDDDMRKQILDAAAIFKGGGGCEKLQEEFIKYIDDDDMRKQILDAAAIFKGGGGCEKLQEEFIKYIDDDDTCKQILDAAAIFKGGGGAKPLQKHFIKHLKNTSKDKSIRVDILAAAAMFQHSFGSCEKLQKAFIDHIGDVDDKVRKQILDAADVFKYGGGCEKLQEAFIDHIDDVDDKVRKQIIDAANVFKQGGGCEKLQEEFIKYIDDDDTCKQILEAAKVFKYGGGCKELQQAFIKHIDDVDDKVRKQILEAAEIFKRSRGCRELQKAFVDHIDDKDICRDIFTACWRLRRTKGWCTDGDGGASSAATLSKILIIEFVKEGNITKKEIRDAFLNQDTLGVIVRSPPAFRQAFATNVSIVAVRQDIVAAASSESVRGCGEEVQTYFLSKLDPGDGVVRRQILDAASVLRFAPGLQHQWIQSDPVHRMGICNWIVQQLAAARQQPPLQ